MPVRVTVWHEFRHEKKNPKVAEIYPQGMHEAIASHLRRAGDMEVRTATLDEPAHGLTDAVLESTDVLTWWGHIAHDEVDDKVVEKVHKRVLAGMGLLVLHSGHFSKIFKRLMGTCCDLKWREADDREIIWVTSPNHPIAQGIDDRIDIEAEEMYGEYFDVPAPEDTVFASWFSGGEVFRSGLTWKRGAGKIFYFRPGHETYPTYHHPQVLRVIENGVRWCAPAGEIRPHRFGRYLGKW